MGIFGLLTYLKEHQDQATVKVDLKQVAQETTLQGSTPFLFCDFSNIVKELEMNVVHGTVASGKQSKFTKFYGGHLHTLSAEFKSFILALKSTGVEPVFVLDGKDTRGPKSAQWSTTEDRYMQSLERCDKWHQVCAGYRSSHHVPTMPHPFAVHCCKRVLLDTGSRFVQCQGEADGTLIALCCSTPGAIGILSNDTDFAVARNCSFFPLCLFDADETVGFYNGKLKEDPPFITCRYTSDSILSTCLGIRIEQVTDLAILCGNDYTKPLNAQYHVHRYIGCNSSNVTSIAQWLEGLTGPLRENEKMKEFLDIHPDYGKALLESDATYLSQSTETKVLPSVSEQEHSLRFNTLFKALENGFIKRDFFVEDLTHGKEPVADQTLPIRRLTYSLLGLRKVKEYGRTRTARELLKFGCCKVKSSQTMPGVPEHLRSRTDIPLSSKAICLYFLLANPQSASENLTELCQATEHQPFYVPSQPEPCNEADYTRALIALGLVKFTTTVMRLHKEERLAVVIAFILTAAHGPALYFSCRPSMRAVHLAGLLCTALHSALPLCELLSLPTSSLSYEDIFDSSIFVALYMAICTGSKDNASLRQMLRLCKEVQGITAAEAVLAFLSSGTCLEVLSVSDAARQFMKAVSSVKNDVLPRHIPQLASIRPAPLTFPTRRYSSDEEEEEDLESEEEMQSTPTYRVEKQSQPVKKALPTQQKYSAVKLLKDAKELPIMKHGQEIVELIENHKVSIIEGQTGSGKSTQVPQFILDHAIEMHRSHLCKIIVTQPRRMAAKTLAERVSKERDEPMNKTVGYRIGGESSGDKNSLKITFVTSGWLLKFLTGNPEGMKEYTHIILDEVHERSTQADFLCLVVRNLLVQLGCITKVVLMSATLEGSLYSRYFQKKGLKVSASLEVGGRQFPVKEYFLDDVADHKVHLALEADEEYSPTSGLVSLRQQAGKQAASASRSLLSVENSERKMKLRSDDPRIAICCDLIFSQARLGEGTLVFVPGFDELMTVYEAVSFKIEGYGVGRHFKVFLLHSQIPMSEQKEAFEEPAPGVAHILLATNVAESSVTVPKLRLVINFCLRRGLRYDTRQQMSMLDLDWCSHASCKQRAGRAGRVFPGVAIHLVPKRFHDKEFPPYDAPDMRTTSMPKVYLEAKNLSNNFPFGGPSELLMDTLTPPSDMNVIDAVRELHDIGAISAKSEEKGHITVLGHLGLKLSVNLSLCRLILFGICFECPEAAIIMAAGLSMKQDVFSTPLTFMEEKEYHNLLWMSAKTRWKYDHGQYSEPHMYVKLFRDWMEFKQEKRKSNLRNRKELAIGFAKGKGMSWERLLQLESSVGDIAQRTKTFVPQECNLYAQLDTLSKLRKTSSCAVSRWAGVMGCSAMSTHDTEVVKIHGDPVTYKRLLVAAFSHNLLIGQAAFLEETRFGEETSRVVGDAHAEGITLKDRSTLYMRPFHQAEKHEKSEVIQPVTEDDLLQVAEGIVWERKHIQTWCFVNGEERTAVVKFHASFLENPKTECMRKHEGESRTESLNFANARSQVIAPDAMLQCDAVIAWQFGLRRQYWTFGNIRNMPRVLHPCSTAFSLVSENKIIVLADGWRNPVGVACDVKNTAPFYAVAANLISLGAITKASGMCILPRLGKGATAVHPLLMVLAFLDFHRSVKFCRVKGNTKKFSAILIDGYELRCPDGHCISLADIMMINRVRKALSEVMSHRCINHSILPIYQMAYIRPLIRSLLSEDTDIDTVCEDASGEITVDDEEQQDISDSSDSSTDTDTESENDWVECAGMVKSDLWQPEHWNNAGSNQFPLFTSVVPLGATLVKRLQREEQIKEPETHCLAPTVPWNHKGRSGQLNSDSLEYKEQHATGSSDMSDSEEQAVLFKRIDEDPSCSTTPNKLFLTVSGTLPRIKESASVSTFSVRCTGESEASSDEDSDS